MKHASTADRRSMFRILLESDSAQAALMNLQPGAQSGAFGNEHPLAEQWLYVIAGKGVVRYATRRKAIAAGDLILILRGEPHQILNTAARGTLRTLNFYAPPAYTKSGNVKPSVRA